MPPRTLIALAASAACFGCAPRSPSDPPQAPPTPTRWQVVAGVHSHVTFTFPPPYAEYQGRTTRVRGEITLSGQLNTMRGRFDADTASVTLGAADIDENALSAMFISADAFPTATYTIERVVPGTPDGGTMHGTFSIKGRAAPVDVAFELQPVAGHADQRRLRAHWKLHILDDFGIPGPGTQTEAGIVLLNADLLLLQVPPE